MWAFLLLMNGCRHQREDQPNEEREDSSSTEHRRHSTRFISRLTKDKKVKTISMATFLSHSEFTQLASEKQIEKTVQALQAHDIRVVVFDTSEEARKYVLDLIPDGAEVYNSTSRTLELIGLAE